MSTQIDIGNLITRSDDIRGGQPRIAGTGVSVARIVRWYRLGLSPEEICDRIEHLGLAQVHAALAHYHSNREAIDALIAHEDSAGEVLADQARAGRRPASP